MKKTIFSLLIIACFSQLTSCKDSSKKEAASSTSTTEIKNDEENSSSGETTGKKDERMKNVGEAKRPKGKMSYVVDGTPVTIDENTVQCMYIGMNSTMAQSVISGGNKVTIVHMGIPKVGPIEIESIGSLPSVGIQLIIDGIQYNNKKVADAKLFLTKVTPDGKNYYVAGTFSGTLTSLDGTKTITVTDGVFESAYL